MIPEPVSLVLITLAVLNATIGEQHIPVEVTTTLVPEVASGSSAAESGTVATPIPGIALDAATLTAVAGIAGGAYAAFRKSAGRANATADTTVNVADSLKATDYGSAETAGILAEALSELSTVNQEIATAISKSNHRARENAKQWNQDNREYYENLPTAPRAGEMEGDKVKTKLAQVNKITEPTADP
jgi:hypothetical protein